MFSRPGFGVLDGLGPVKVLSYWGKSLAEKTRTRESPTPALASFAHSAPKALEVVVEVEHPPTSECLVMEWP